MRTALSVLCRISYSNVTQQHDRDKGGVMDSLQAKGSSAFTITAAVQLPVMLIYIYITYISVIYIYLFFVFFIPTLNYSELLLTQHIFVGFFSKIVACIISCIIVSWMFVSFLSLLNLCHFKSNWLKKLQSILMVILDFPFLTFLLELPLLEVQIMGSFNLNSNIQNIRMWQFMVGATPR